MAMLILLLAAAFAYYRTNKTNLPHFPKQKPANQSNSNHMKITSTSFNQNGMIPSKYTCDGENVNPALSIGNIPRNTKSLALIMHDPDASNGDWTHWIMWNIDPGTKEIPENKVPMEAIQGKTSFGQPGYGGPCPPSGTHHYHFALYALDTILDLSPDTDKTGLEAAMSGHIVDKTELIGLYSKK